MKRTLYETVLISIRRQVPALFLFSCLVNILLLVTILYMLQVYDRVLATGSLDTLLWLTIGALAAIVIYGFLEQARRVILLRIGTWLNNRLAGPVTRLAMEARLHGTGCEAGPKDVADLRNFVGGEGVLAFLDAPWTVIFIAFIWLLHPALGLLATLGALLLFGLALANDLVTRAKQRHSTGTLRENHDAALRYIDGGETISPLGMSGAILSKWQERESEALAEQQRIGERTAAILSLSRVIRLALQILILGIGAYYVLEGELTGGAMIAASIILARALVPVERSISTWHRYVGARQAHRNLRSLFAATSPAGESVALPRPDGRISVENANYLAPLTRDPILTNITFALEPGQTLAIVGPSGSGKSSLCRLLVGAWKPQLGHVRLDGADVFAWDAIDLGQHIGYMPQQIELYPGTVAENIARFGEIDSGKLVAAARRASVHEMILKLPEGYETNISLHDMRISLGQRQRLGLARAVYNDPAIVILDEPNSNLDSDGDLALNRALAELKQQGCTVVIVTHRPAALQTADRILILRGGSIIRFGTRDEVLKPQEVLPQQFSMAGKIKGRQVKTLRAAAAPPSLSSPDEVAK
jgi:PrtD family type I secretion system ABC transporter